MKKTLSWILLTILVLSLFACDGGTPALSNAAVETTTASAPVLTPEPTTVPTSEPTPEPTMIPTPLPPVQVSGTSNGSVAGHFSDGLAWYKDANNKYGYINTKGEVVISAQYSAAGEFKNGLAVVSYSDRNAVHDIVIDKNNQTVFMNMDSGSVYIDYDDFDKEVLPVVEIFKATIRNNKYQNIEHDGFNYMLESGKLLTKDKFTYVGGFCDGIAKVGVGQIKKGLTKNTGSSGVPFARYRDYSGNGAGNVATKFYHIRKDGSKVETSTYDDAGDFSEGLASVAVRNLQWGYVDTTGTVVIPLEWDSANAFEDGKAIVSKSGKYGMIDNTGNLVIPLSFDSISSFHENLAAVKTDEKYGYINQSGQFVIPAEWDTAWNFQNGQAIVGKKNGDNWMYSVINVNGELITDNLYTLIYSYSDLGYYRFREVDKGPEGLMKLDGTVVIEPVWDSLYPLGDETMLICVKQGDKYGLIDWNGLIVREPEFDSVKNAFDGVSIVIKEGVWFIMDPKTGEIIF